MPREISQSVLSQRIESMSLQSSPLSIHPFMGGGSSEVGVGGRQADQKWRTWREQAHRSASPGIL